MGMREDAKAAAAKALRASGIEHRNATARAVEREDGHDGPTATATNAMLAVIDQYEPVEGWFATSGPFFPTSEYDLDGCANYTASTIYRKKQPEPEPVTVPRETLALIVEAGKSVRELSTEEKQALVDGEKLLT